MTPVDVLIPAAAGHRLSAPEALALTDVADPRPLMRVAAALRDDGHGGLVSYSRKVFIPLTQLCRDAEDGRRCNSGRRRGIAASAG